MLNIVIPMAGAGSRFAVAGYTTPKPFIMVGNKMMIEHVLDSLHVPDARYILVLQQAFLEQNKDAVERVKRSYSVEFITVRKLTQGAACTALASHPLINNAEPVLFADSDNFFDPGIILNLLNDAKKRDLDGSLLTVASDSQKFSYVKTNEDGYAVETREKEVISDHAICGVYYFKHGSDFVVQTINMMIYGDRSKNEFYMSNVYNYMIAADKRIGVFDIPIQQWHCVGTPEQLQKYLFSEEMKGI